MLLSRAQKRVAPTIRIFPILICRKEFDDDDDKNCIFVVRIRIPAKTSISAKISRRINFSLKNTIAKRIENKISPLINIDESDAEVLKDHKRKVLVL